MEHQDYPFALLVQQLQPARHASRSPFFDVMFNLNSAGIGHDGGGPAPTQSGGGDLPLEAQPQAQGEGQFDLILQIFDSGRVLSGTLEYNTDLLDAATMERMASHFRVLLAGIVADRDVLVASLPLLTDAERHCLLPGNGRRLPEFDAGTPLPQLFERQVERPRGLPSASRDAA
jgi:non-ribosomal peptide synthetase component F